MSVAGPAHPLERNAENLPAAAFREGDGGPRFEGVAVDHPLAVAGGEI
jgi:hypothetical protein